MVIIRNLPFLLFLAALSVLISDGIYGNAASDGPTVMVPNDHEESLELQVPLDKTQGEREAFRKELLSDQSPYDLRPLYEKYIGRIGANGIIHEVEGLNPTCHVAGHPLGMVIYEKIGKIRPALLACQDACNSACMHGVFLASLSEIRPNQTKNDQDLSGTGIIPALRARIGSLCSEAVLSGLYKPGDCAHGIGHAIMHMVNDDLHRALENCRLFDRYPMQYYCATGVYMQYMDQHDREDSLKKSSFYPCDSNDYPAACFRYKMVHVMKRNYTAGKTEEAVVKQCLALKAKYRLGCFHGLGNAHMRAVTKGVVPLSVVCHFGSEDDQFACIDGVMERMGKYYPQVVERRCKALSGWRRDLCEESGQRGMYALDKSFKFYPR